MSKRAFGIVALTAAVTGVAAAAGVTVWARSRKGSRRRK